MFSNLNTQPMATSHMLYAADATAHTAAWQLGDSSVTASQESSTSTTSWQTDAHQLISSGSGTQTADSARTLASSAGAHQSSSQPRPPEASSQQQSVSQPMSNASANAPSADSAGTLASSVGVHQHRSQPPGPEASSEGQTVSQPMSKPAAANNAFRFAQLDDAEAEYTATQPSACASSSETPKWIVANRRMVQERRNSGDGEPEPGPLPWMRIGQRGASNPLDVGYYDLKTCQEVPLEVTSTLDAFHRDGTRPQPKLHFKGQESWCLIREVPDDHDATSRVYLGPLRKAHFPTIKLQPNEKIYRTLSGTYYCEHYEEHGCGCLIAVSFSTKTCSHSVRAGGTFKRCTYETIFTHSCPAYLRTQRTITNAVNGTELTLVTQVPIQVEELLKVLASAKVDMYTAYQSLRENNFTMERAAFYRWYEAQLARNARGSGSVAQRLASKQLRAQGVGTTFIIKPFDGNRPGVASVYVQTKEMQKHIDNAAVVSIDGSRVKHGRGVLLATAKCAFDKLQIVALAVISGGETGASMRALYEELGLKGKQQVRDDGTCYDRRWLQIMVDDNVYWVLCPWHKKMEIPPTIVSWVNGEPTLQDAVWLLMLKRFPEGDDDPSVEYMVDLAFRNLRAYYKTEAATKQIDSVELAKERYLVTYRDRYMDDVIASSVPPDTALSLACASSEPGGGSKCRVRVQMSESSNASFKHASNAAPLSTTDDDDGLLEELERLENTVVRRTTEAKLELSKALKAGQSTSANYRAELEAAITRVHGYGKQMLGTYSIEEPRQPAGRDGATHITVRHTTTRRRTILVKFDIGSTEFHSPAELGLATTDGCSVGSRVRICASRRVRPFGRVPMPNALGGARNPRQRRRPQAFRRRTRRDPPLRLPLRG